MYVYVYVIYMYMYITITHHYLACCLLYINVKANGLENWCRCFLSPLPLSLCIYYRRKLTKIMNNSAICAAILLNDI